jgi:hypothetical protein
VLHLRTLLEWKSWRHAEILSRVYQISLTPVYSISYPGKPASPSGLSDGRFCSLGLLLC